MQTDNKFFDDMARLASGAMGTVFGLREEFEAQVRQQVENIMQRFDLVTREEFDAMSIVAQDAKAEAEELSEKLAALETQIAGLTTPAVSSTAKKTTKTASKSAAKPSVAKKTAAKTPRKTAAKSSSAKRTTTKKS
ncbi:MAG: accessory factor UbiK family protein [Pseudomonadota bacterium]